MASAAFHSRQFSDFGRQINNLSISFLTSANMRWDLQPLLAE
jgi:hypothetical protein